MTFQVAASAGICTVPPSLTVPDRVSCWVAPLSRSGASGDTVRGSSLPTTSSFSEVNALPLMAMIRPVPVRCGVSLPSAYEARDEGTIRTVDLAGGRVAEPVDGVAPGPGWCRRATVVTVLPPFTTTLAAAPGLLGGGVEEDAVGDRAFGVARQVGRRVDDGGLVGAGGAG